MGIDSWQEMPFDQAVEVNPAVTLVRGRNYPFVDMQSVEPFTRDVGPSEMREYSGGGARFKVGDTLMARITPSLENGKVSRFEHENPETIGHGSTEFIVVRGRQGVTLDVYAYYLTIWDGVRQYAISQMTGSSGRQRVPTDSLSNVTVPVPPLPEQRAIAHVLGTLDDKIELNRRMNETLEGMARALFKSWFVDFDPVRAKIDGRWQPGHSLPGLPVHLYDLFPDRLVTSELGEIPEGWEVRNVGGICEVNPRRSLRKGDTAPYLAMSNMPTSGHVPLDVIEREFGSGMRFANGDTLLARITPCLENGKTAFVDFLDEGSVGWGSTEYIVLRSKPPWPHEFAYCLARSSRFRTYAIRRMTGSSGRQRVSAAVISDFQLALPSDSKLATFFALQAKPLFERGSKTMQQSQVLAGLRNTLLPKLISGELRLPADETAAVALEFDHAR